MTVRFNFQFERLSIHVGAAEQGVDGDTLKLKLKVGILTSGVQKLNRKKQKKKKMSECPNIDGGHCKGCRVSSLKWANVT